MNATYFTYNGISSRLYDMVIGSFSGSDDGSQAVGNVNMTVVKAPHTNKFLRASATYDNQLQISFSVMKMNCYDMNDYIFTERDIGFILRWLGRKEYYPLRFEQEGWENVIYYATFNISEHMVGGNVVGFDLVATCNAPWGFDQQQTSSTSIDGIGTVRILDDSDEIGIIYPDATFYFTDDCDLEVYNAMTQTTTKIYGCVQGETIKMSNFSIESDECVPDDTGGTYEYRGKHPRLYDQFNWQWIPIGNYFTPTNTEDSRVNNLTIKGNCDVTFKWSAPRKAVI